MWWPSGSNGLHIRLFKFTTLVRVHAWQVSYPDAHSASFHQTSSAKLSHPLSHEWRASEWDPARAAQTMHASWMRLMKHLTLWSCTPKTLSMGAKMFKSAEVVGHPDHLADNIDLANEVCLFVTFQFISFLFSLPVCLLSLPHINILAMCLFRSYHHHYIFYTYSPPSQGLW